MNNRNNENKKVLEYDENGAPVISEEERAEREARMEIQRMQFHGRKQQAEIDAANNRRKNRIIALCAAAAVLVGCITWLFLAGTVKMPGGWVYKKSGEGYTLWEYKGDQSDVSIPERVLFRPVTAIDGKAFTDSDVVKVTIPDSVKTIADRTFAGSSIKEIIIPDSVTYLGREAFSYCENLTKITLPEGLECIEYSLFSNCTALTEVNIPANVSIVRAYAFSGCTALEAINAAPENKSFFSNDGMLFSRDGILVCCPASKENISAFPEDIHTIGTTAFSGCKLIESIAVPEGVTSIEANAFSGCEALKEITLPSTLTNLDAAAISYCPALNAVNTNGGSFRSVDGVLFSGDMKTLICFPANRAGSYTVPAGVTAIGDNAFMGCKNLTDITLPEGLASIGDQAFHSCSALKSIVMPDSVTSLGNSAFYFCEALEKVVLSKGLTFLPREVFTYCESLTAIDLHEGITSIGYDAFAYGPLKSIVMPSTLETIDTSAFYGCSELTEVVLNEGLKTIESGVFGGCGSLTELTIPNSVEAIGDISFNSCNITITAPHDASYYNYTTEDGVTWVVK